MEKKNHLQNPKEQGIYYNSSQIIDPEIKF